MSKVRGRSTRNYLRLQIQRKSSGEDGRTSFYYLSNYIINILLFKVAALSANAAKTKAAHTVVKALATKSGRRMKRSNVRSAASCTEVHAHATDLHLAVAEAPAHPEILDHAAKIIASDGLTCLEHEKPLLTQVSSELEKATTTLDSAVATGQSQLAALTGTTASVEFLVTTFAPIAVEETTVAPVAASETTGVITTPVPSAPASTANATSTDHGERKNQNQQIHNY